MKLLLPVLAAGVLADSNMLARLIAQRDPTPDFPAFVTRRVGDLSQVISRLDTMAVMAVHVKEKIGGDTDKFLSVNGTPNHLLAQIDGIATTIEHQKEKLCRKHFEDAMEPCAQLIAAVGTWINANLCLKYADFLNEAAALEYNVCVDYLPPAEVI